MKRPKQYIVTVAGVAGVGVTFTPAEEARVRKKAARLGVTVEDLIARAIAAHRRAPANRKRALNDVIPLAVKALAAPAKRKKAA